MQKIINVYASFDSNFQTWNVFDFDRHCLFYGTAYELDNWLILHSEFKEVI